MRGVVGSSMGRPKKATAGGRKALAKKDANVPVQVELKPVEDNVVDEAEDLEEQLRIVNLVCNAVDQEGALSFSSLCSV